MAPQEGRPVSHSVPELLRFAEFVLDIRTRALYRGSERVRLTLTPTETLITLALAAGRVVSKEALIQAVWKDTVVTDDNLVQAIKEIRRALGEKSGEDRFIQTVHRHGYRFVAPVTASRADEDASGGPWADEPVARRWWWDRVGASRVPVRPRSLVVLLLCAVAVLALASIAATWLARPSSRSVEQQPSAVPGAGARLTGASAEATIRAAGLVLDIQGDANQNAEATLEWRPVGDGPFRPAHPFIRVDATHLVGSVFWLEPATTYEARLTLSDPDGVIDDPTRTLAFSTRPEAVPSPTLATLFVAPTGRDTNPGNAPGQALRTIQRAADLARAGDVVLIAPGVYRETVRVRRSGTGRQPIVLRGAGPAVVLDGADERIASGVAWSAVGRGVFAVEAGFPTTHVTTEQGRLFRYESLDDLAALRAGPPGGFFTQDGRLYLKLTDGSAPDRHRIHASRLDHAVILDGRSHVAVEHLEIRHYGGREPGVGVLLRNCGECAIRHCRIHEVGRAGIWVEGGEQGRIEDNEIWDTSIATWPWHETNLSASDNHGIFFWGPAPRGFVIQRNRVRGTFDGIAPCGSAPAAGRLTTETDVTDNLIADVADDAIEAEPYCSNLRIWGNRFERGLMAVSLAPAAPGPSWVIRNIAYRFGEARAREVWYASALKINTAEPIRTGPVLLYHNTFVTDVPDVDAVALLEPGTVAAIRSRNNVLAATRRALYKVNRLLWDGDGDLLFTTGRDLLVHWQEQPFATLDAFQRATGQEAGGLSLDPRLANPADGRFEPGSGSPLIDRGVLLAGINDGFAGRAPDIGAIEVRR